MKRQTLIKIFSDIPMLETPRLLLRKMKVSDAEDMFDYAKRPDVTAYLLWSPHTSRSYTEDYLRYLQSRYALGEFYDWAVVDRESGRMIGTCGFTHIDLAHRCGELGYVLNPDFHGHGLGTEAAERVLDFGFDRLELHRIEARFMRGNDVSLRVMEKLGMTFEGYRRDAMWVKQQYRTVGTCAVLADEHRRKLKKEPQ
ncbi:MAG: GNAT family N-acetyltransferase [Clostridia bacterium]|nr:GNAT family N-acetyltransferase [Clostridia bacterium]